MDKFIKNIMIMLVPEHMILWRKRGRKNAIALTFDDGPNINFTPKILDILNEKKIKATFFLIGKEVEKNNNIAERIVRDGHCVGMHSYLHKKNAEMAKSKDIIKRETGVTSKLFRPPHGAISVSQLLYCLKNRITTVMWSVNSMDYMNIRPEDVIKNSVENGINGGDVILFHDDNERTVKALPDIIDSLTLRGFRFATVEELLK